MRELYAKKIYGTSEVKFHSFLTTVIGEEEASNSRFGCLILNKMSTTYLIEVWATRLQNQYQRDVTHQIPSAGGDLLLSRLSPVTLAKPSMYSDFSHVIKLLCQFL
jgi:hypothetical protein